VQFSAIYLKQQEDSDCVVKAKNKPVVGISPILSRLLQV
jgi:hypothetical protein